MFMYSKTRCYSNRLFTAIQGRRKQFSSAAALKIFLVITYKYISLIILYFIYNIAVKLEEFFSLMYNYCIERLSEPEEVTIKLKLFRYIVNVIQKKAKFIPHVGIIRTYICIPIGDTVT